MTADSPNHAEQDDPLLRELSPHQLARLIRSLDSRLVGIEYDHRRDVLVYSFEVAGKKQAFPVAIEPAKLVSIVDVYPEAAGYERALRQQFGLTFQKANSEER